MSDGGQRRPYRQVPHDFVELWPQFGWGGAKEKWRAHGRTIERWVDECGRDRMVLARKAYVASERVVTSRARRKNYVLGKTMTPVRPEFSVPVKKDGPGNS